MVSYLTRRLFYAAVTFLGITIAVFILIHAVPGDPVDYYLSGVGTRSVPKPVVEELRRGFHLDEPLLIQYGYWLRGIVTLDLGRSFIDRRPVLERIVEKLPRTFELNAIALFVALLIALPVGVLSARKPNGWLDRGSALTFFILYSLPSFWVALMLMDLFAVRLEWLPLYGMSSDAAPRPYSAQLIDHARHLILPVVTLAYAQLAIFARFCRAALLEVERKDFITAARARGVGETELVLKHIARNALIPMITLLGLVVPYLLSGSVIVERIFQWDGIGNLYFDAILSRDYPTIMGLTVVTAVVTLLASVLADLLYSLADPRIRLGEER